MKYLLILPLIFLFSVGRGQRVYGSLKTLFLNSEHSFGGGGSFSIGRHTQSMGVGGGVGVISFGRSNPMIPVFVEVTHVGKSKLSPYFNWQFGYLKYDGDGNFAGYPGLELHAPVYMSLTGGVALGGNQARILVYAGITPFVFEDKSKDVNIWKSLFSFGVGVFLKGKKPSQSQTQKPISNNLKT